LIHYIKGHILKISLSPRKILVTSSCGIGVEFFCTADSQLEENQEGEFFLSPIIRENSCTYFGFLSSNKKDLFELLNQVKGLGPKLSLQILEGHSCEEVLCQIKKENTNFFKQISGIGPKVSAQIILDLKKKAEKSFISESTFSKESIDLQKSRSEEEEVFLALISLGKSSKEAEFLLQEYKKNHSQKASPSEILRGILQSTLVS